MEKIKQSVSIVFGGCVLAAMFWLMLAGSSFVSEHDTVIHAVALRQMAGR